MFPPVALAPPIASPESDLLLPTSVHLERATFMPLHLTPPNIAQKHRQIVRGPWGRPLWHFNNLGHSGARKGERNSPPLQHEIAPSRHAAGRAPWPPSPLPPGP